MNKKRNWAYLILILTGFFLVAGKQRAIIRDRDRVVTSTVAEWEHKGKPVVVYRVQKRDVPLHAKVTASKISDHMIQGYVSKEVRDRIELGQDITFQEGVKEFRGAVSSVSQELSLGTGMYRVEATFDRMPGLTGWVVAYARIRILEDVVCVPTEIIDKEGGKTFVWKVEEGKAVRQEVAIGTRDGYGAVITQGLREGDLVIVKGFFMLSQGDGVNILRFVNAGEMEND